MIDISIQNIKKAFEEGNDILDGLTFDVNEGERVGLLGKNGAGKTTLLRLITGEISPDEGTIVVPGFKKIGLISQIPEYPQSYIVEDVLSIAFDRLKSIKSDMEMLEKKMSEKDAPEALKTYDELAYEYERSGGYSTDYELNRVANGLRIPDTQRAQRFDTLSGGEKTRINLARLILEKTDVLLLDEPTNHLDMRAVEWLEEFLAKYRGTALIISHDRYFLDKTISRAIEISSGKAEFYSGNYSFYALEKQRRFEEQLGKYERERAEAKRLNDAADRLKQWGTGNKHLMRKSFAVRTRAERAMTTDKPKKENSVRAKFGEREFHGDKVLLVQGLTKAFDDRKLIDIDKLEVLGGERIAIIGDNGAGKTTLAKLLVGEEKPDSGIVRRGPSVKYAYLPQIVKFESPRRTLMDMLIYELDVSPQMARNRLGAFMFSGEDVFKLVGDLSGGEKSRLKLCLLMKEEINLLILDEPTNHLDLPSREWIENAVGEYGETLIFISHDRYFINRYATRIWALEDGIFTDFLGSYSDFRAFKAQKAKELPGNLGSLSETRGEPGEKGIKTAADKKELAATRKQNRRSSDIQKEIRRIEREIDKLENGLGDIALLKDEFSTDYEKLMELDERERALQNALDKLYKEWEQSTI